MGDFPSGQRGQTVNLLAMPSVVRIHHPPPKSRLQKRSAFYFCAFRYSPPRKPLTAPHSLYPSVGGDTYIAPPPVLLATLRRGDPCGRPRAGKSAKRRQWRMKQAGFEEVPRLAGTTVPVSRSAQRWAREPRPYAPSRTHCTGRTGSSAPTTLFVGADAYIGPTGYFPHPRQGTRALPYKIAWCRAAPLITDAGRRGRRPLQ